MSAAKRKRRSPQEMVADLEARIARIRARAERRKAKKDPALRHIAAAVRSIDKALAEAEDVVTRQTLDEARATLRAVLSLSGAMPKVGRGGVVVQANRGRQVQPEDVLQYITSHPGSRCEDIAATVGADTKAVSSVLRSLRAEGKVRSEGQARGTRYFAAAGP